MCTPQAPGGVAAKKDKKSEFFKMHIIDIEDVDESDDEVRTVASVSSDNY